MTCWCKISCLQQHWKGFAVIAVVLVGTVCLEHTRNVKSFAEPNCLEVRVWLPKTEDTSFLFDFQFSNGYPITYHTLPTHFQPRSIPNYSKSKNPCQIIVSIKCFAYSCSCSEVPRFPPTAFYKRPEVFSSLETITSRRAFVRLWWSQSGSQHELCCLRISHPRLTAKGERTQTLSKRFRWNGNRTHHCFA